MTTIPTTGIHRVNIGIHLMRIGIPLRRCQRVRPSDDGRNVAA
jgi:hypothetical protein